jgi:hypothetical protein
MDESKSDYITITEAAQLLDTTEALVLVMLQNNELHGEMVDGTWHVDRSSIDLSDMTKSTELEATVGCGICGSRCGSGC